MDNDKRVRRIRPKKLTKAKTALYLSCTILLIVMCSYYGPERVEYLTPCRLTDTSAVNLVVDSILPIFHSHDFKPESGASVITFRKTKSGKTLMDITVFPDDHYSYTLLSCLFQSPTTKYYCTIEGYDFVVDDKTLKNAKVIHGKKLKFKYKEFFIVDDNQVSFGYELTDSVPVHYYTLSWFPWQDLTQFELYPNVYSDP